MYDYTPMSSTVAMWASEVASSDTDIHITNTAREVMWLYKVAAIEHEGERCES